jgi:hypothetical protein
MLEGISVDIRRSNLAAAAAVLLTIVMAACAGPGGADLPTALPTPVVLDQVSLPPASDEVPPPSQIPDVGDIPSVPPPSGDAETPAVEVGYDLGADDADAFAAAYRSAFGTLELTDEQVDTAGARLCTYLMRNADADGFVELDAAIAEADVNQPGFGPETWETAFGIATDHYCGEYSL